MNLFELTKKLVNIPSVTDLEDEIADFLCSYLKSRNFDLKEQVIDERRRNILATAGLAPREKKQ